MGAKRLQIGTESSNRGKEISIRDKDYKSRQEGLQIGAGISNGAEHSAALRQPFSEIDLEL